MNRKVESFMVICCWVLGYEVVGYVTRDLINSGWFVGNDWRQTCLGVMWMIFGMLSVWGLEWAWKRDKK